MERMHNWHHTTVGLLFFFVCQVALVYIFASLAIARGNLWYYILATVWLIAGIQNLVGLIRKGLVHHA